MSATVVLATDHGVLGGGEIMLLESARALAALGIHPVVVAPEEPGELLREARSEGWETVTYAGGGGALRELRHLRGGVTAARRAHPGALLWCHGLRSALACAGIRDRIVHVHRVPDAHQVPAAVLACRGARDVLVPSHDTLARLPVAVRGAAHVLLNWTRELTPVPRRIRSAADPVRVGFLGRPAPGKGIPELARAVEILGREHPEWRVELTVAGAPHFVTPGERAAVTAALTRPGITARRLGWVERTQFLGGVDVLVCPSRWPESFGLVVAEAMGAGVPVVVSDAEALREVAGPDHPYVARAGDAEDLARVLERACRELGTAEGDAVVRAARERWEAVHAPSAGRRRVAHALERWGVRA